MINVDPDSMAVWITIFFGIAAVAVVYALGVLTVAVRQLRPAGTTPDARPVAVPAQPTRATSDHTRAA